MCDIINKYFGFINNHFIYIKFKLEGAIMKQNETTRKLLISYYQTHKKLQIQDIFKFIYQSTFGCEHMISSLEKAIEHITNEYNNIYHENNFNIEPLDGPYSRVPLSYLNSGLSISTLGKLFFLSSKKESGNTEDLIQKLKIAQELITENLLPFSLNDFHKSVEEWASENYPAIHHSDIFKKEYQPSYRVISNTYTKFLPLFTEIDKHLVNGNVKIAIEGGSASGKTTLSKILTDIYDCTIFHMDDFFLRPEQRTPERFAEIGGNIDRERFLSEILQPLNRNETINYRKFNCSTMSIGELVSVVPKKLIIIEGAYSMHPDLRDYYDFSVFLDVSPELQKERILHRNPGPMAQRFFEQWIPLEKQYFSEMEICEKCDLKISISQ